MDDLVVASLAGALGVRIGDTEVGPAGDPALVRHGTPDTHWSARDNMSAGRARRMPR